MLADVISFIINYKKVDGLRWQCSICINEFNGIWKRLDDFIILVNDIKTTINLGSLVKSAVSEVFRESVSINHTPQDPLIVSNNPPVVRAKTTKRKRRQSKQGKPTISSTPVNGSISHTSSSSQGPVYTVNLESSTESMNVTVIPTAEPGSTQTIGSAENRTYLWLRGFHYETTSNQVIDLVAKTINVNGSDIICRSLKSSRRAYTESDHISFRVGLRPTDVKNALSTKNWPNGVVCKLFNSKNLNTRQPVRLS